MQRLLTTLNYKWCWKELQKLDPEPQDLAYVASMVPRGSSTHYLVANKINSEIGGKYVRGVTYPTLIKLLAVAVGAF